MADIKVGKRSRLTQTVWAFVLIAVIGRVMGNIVADGGFEGYYEYPCMYAHENARMKAVVDAGWDVGGTEKFIYPVTWTVRLSPAGYLRASDDAHSGKKSLAFGKGGVIYCPSYITPTEPVGKYPLQEGRSGIIRVWAKGTGQLTARIREYPPAGGPSDVDVGPPAPLTAEWKEYIFIYTPKAPAPESIELSFMADGLAKVDDASMIDVVAFDRLVAGLSADLASAQADAGAGLVDKAAVATVAPEINDVLRKAQGTSLALPEQLALRDEIAPVAQRLAAIAWQGKGRRAGRIGLATERLKVEFYGADLNFRLAALGDPGRGVDFLGPFGSEVWRIRLVNPAWKPEWDPAAQVPAKLFLTSDFTCASRTSHLSQRGRKLTLNWLGVEIPGTAATLDVCVTVSLPKGARLARWHIKVSGGVKEVAVNEVHFPLLATLTPMTADGADDYLVIPQISGRLIRNPYRSGDLSPYMTLQMWALYSEKAGLYCAPEDGDASKKLFAFQPVPTEKQMHAQVIHYPENNMTGGNGYDMPFETVLGTFDGTWWAASKIYRKWAVEQKWCKAFGPLHSSKDTPQWYKDLPIWILMYEMAGTEEDVLSGKVNGAMLGNYRGTYPGVPLAYHYYGWEEGHRAYAQGEHTPGFGMKGWPVLIQQLHENGARVVPYVQGSLFNTKFNWFTKEGGDAGRVHFPGGGYTVYPDEAGGGYANMTWMCPASSLWQDYHVKVAKLLANSGADGIYYDSFPCWYPCYNPSHGHPLGSGKALTDGNRRLIARTRAAAKAINPEMIFVSETPEETVVGALDGCLQFQFASQADNIPLFSSVYHDYLLLWGNTFGAKYETYGEWAFIPTAYSFIRGDQLGWFAQAWHQATEYTTYLAHLRMGAAQKFVTYGEMLEPPAFLNAVPTVTTPAWNVNAEKDRTLPAVLHSAWKAPDGTIGLVFANIAAGVQEVEYAFDAARYGLPVGKNYHYRVTEMVSKNIVGDSPSPNFRRKDKILPRQALILEISAGTSGK